MTDVKTLAITEARHGQRLDKVLEDLLPGLGARARRRVWDASAILVNGKARPRGFVVIAGDTVSLAPRQNAGEVEGLATVPAPQQKPVDTMEAPEIFCERRDFPRFVQAHGALCFFYKPAGMHTTAHEGGSADTLEHCLAALLPPEGPGSVPLLCNRLDQGTSGLVAAAHNAEALESWRRMEAQGLCEKRYVALVHGPVPEAFTVPNALDTRQRKISRVLPEIAPPLRHTRFAPLGEVDTAGKEALACFFPQLHAEQEDRLAFVGSSIHKGSRHQIRAHAAHAGCPLWNDPRYGHERAPQPNECFVLHHGLLRLPGLDVGCLPAWLEALPTKIHNDIEHWFNKDV